MIFFSFLVTCSDNCESGIDNSCRQSTGICIANDVCHYPRLPTYATCILDSTSEFMHFYGTCIDGMCIGTFSSRFTTPATVCSALISKNNFFISFNSPNDFLEHGNFIQNLEC